MCWRRHRQRQSVTPVLPLLVEYKEKTYAAERTGRLHKREGRPHDEETLGELIDRSIRPLFPERFRTRFRSTASPLG